MLTFGGKVCGFETPLTRVLCFFRGPVENTTWETPRGGLTMSNVTCPIFPVHQGH